MCEESNNLVSSITPFREELRVKARVVRLWTKVQKSSDDVPIQYFGFDFVNLRSIRCRVVDSTLLIDPDASNFLMTDASKLLCRELTDDPLKHTNVVGNLVDKVFLFKIFVNEASCVPTPSFQVITMSWDASLIEKLSDKVLPTFDVESDGKSQDESSPTLFVFKYANQLSRPHNDQSA
ncbi:uncharacterized protein G2W53_028828 [Senna tora]|uniref:DUF223 domain-containing protein n=1 Tax=Senna tora TaxID=362788 RepID=A0A834TCY7_9FABA|nr:uncharacterized protein G2W53_028828 [Senna tora]